jgi:hypothetical protein
VNKSANKRKRKLTIGDSAIVDAIKYGFDGIQESEKMKMQMTKEITSQILESEQQGRQLYFQSQLQMACLIGEAFKPKDTVGGFSIDLYLFLVLCECSVEMIIV